VYMMSSPPSGDDETCAGAGEVAGVPSGAEVRAAVAVPLTRMRGASGCIERVVVVVVVRVVPGVGNTRLPVGGRELSELLSLSVRSTLR
jgi:hypothetical protein